MQSVSSPGAVLVVEDEPIIRMEAVFMLEDAGFVVLEAEGSESALHILSERADVRLLFSDINMPGPMDGLRLAHEVHRRWPSVQFILTSGKVRPGRHDLPDDGVYLPKPYSEHQIVSLVRGMLP